MCIHLFYSDLFQRRRAHLLCDRCGATNRSSLCDNGRKTYDRLVALAEQDGWTSRRAKCKGGYLLRDICPTCSKRGAGGRGGAK